MPLVGITMEELIGCLIGIFVGFVGVLTVCCCRPVEERELGEKEDEEDGDSSQDEVRVHSVEMELVSINNCATL